MFGDAKSRGLNIEDTRLTHPRKLALLMALVALAIVWAGRTAATLIRHGSPKRKSHGYFAQSWFRIGFDQIRNLLSSDFIAVDRRLSRLLTLRDSDAPREGRPTRDARERATKRRASRTAVRGQYGTESALQCWDVPVVVALRIGYPALRNRSSVSE